MREESCPGVDLTTTNPKLVCVSTSSAVNIQVPQHLWRQVAVGVKDFPAFDICAEETTLHREEVECFEPVAIRLVLKPKDVPGPQSLDSFQSFEILDVATAPH